MNLTRRQFVAASATGLLLPEAYADAPPRDRDLAGKVMCGYQAWFNAKGDGYDLSFRHYQTNRGLFHPGHCTIDLWPDVSELSKAERFDTAFKHKDGRTAQVYSAAHPKTIARHFEWMRTYGIDGVCVQRFGTNLRNKKMVAHHNAVIKNVRASAKRTGRLWNLMYDLSGMKRGEPQDRVAKDWRAWVEKQGVTDDANYLRHNGKPLVTVWGVGFNDGRKYTLEDCAALIDRLSMGGRFSVMLGVPYYWREQGRDAVKDKALHGVLRKADIISPWSVGRFSDIKNVYKRGEQYLKPDLAWCKNNGKHYLPVAFPGFSWHNLKKSQGKGDQDKLDAIPRRGGRFLWAQAEAARTAGARSLYIAMFDEVDEGTAIFKCTNDPPIGESPFLTYKGLPSDHYLWLTGQIGKRLRLGAGRGITEMPGRAVK